MKKSIKKPTKNQMIVYIVLFSIIIILQAVLAIGSQYLFVRVINVVVTIVCSVGLGAFLRELVLIVQSTKAKNQLESNTNKQTEE